MNLLHGSRSPMVLHVGLCLTDSAAAARCYAERGGYGGGHITTLELPHGLVTKSARGFGKRGAPGDTAPSRASYAHRGIDVITFQDECYGGIEHKTWRLVSEKAVRSVKIVKVQKL